MKIVTVRVVRFVHNRSKGHKAQCWWMVHLLDIRVFKQETVWSKNFQNSVRWLGLKISRSLEESASTKIYQKCHFLVKSDIISVATLLILVPFCRSRPEDSKYACNAGVLSCLNPNTIKALKKGYFLVRYLTIHRVKEQKITPNQILKYHYYLSQI